MSYKETSDFINEIEQIGNFQNSHNFYNLKNVYKGKIIKREKEVVSVQIAKDINVTALLLRCGTKEGYLLPKIMEGVSVLVFCTANAGLLAIPFLPSLEEEDENRLFCGKVEFGENGGKANIVADGENIFEKLIEGLKAIGEGLKNIKDAIEKTAQGVDKVGIAIPSLTPPPPLLPQITSVIASIETETENLNSAIKNLNKITL